MSLLKKPLILKILIFILFFLIASIGYFQWESIKKAKERKTFIESFKPYVPIKVKLLMFQEKAIEDYKSSIEKVSDHKKDLKERNQKAEKLLNNYDEKVKSVKFHNLMEEFKKHEKFLLKTFGWTQTLKEKN